MTRTNQGKFTEQENIQITEVHGDLSQQIVKITVDKLSLILHKHVADIEERKSWIAPLGMLLTIILVLATSSFIDLIFPAATWQAIFVIGALLTSLWLIRSLWRIWHAKNIEDLVDKIKKQE